MVVSFFGHRKIEITKELTEKVKQIVEKLIIDGTNAFIFGSKSEFDSLCYEIVSKLKEKYPNIIRICYNAPHESSFTSKEQARHFEEIEQNLFNKKVHYFYYEQIVDTPKACKAKKNCYVVRNQEMINNSDICIFYYNKNYLPPRRKISKHDILDIQPKSGTGLAFLYAKQKKKKIINVF